MTYQWAALKISGTTSLSGSALTTSMHIICMLMMLFCTGTVQADQNDAGLDELFGQLQEADTAAQARPVEQQIWTIWTRHDKPQYQQLMLEGIAHMNSNNLRAALRTFTHLTTLAPDFAEAWNKRATVHYLLGNYQASASDIAETLKLEPWHFGALSGLGLVKLAQQDYFGARSAFNSALEVNPTMPGARMNLRAIEQFLQRNTI